MLYTLRIEYHKADAASHLSVFDCQTSSKPFPKPFRRRCTMKNDDDLNYLLLKTAYDVKRLRYNVSMMSYIAQSVSWMPVPVLYHEDDD